MGNIEVQRELQMDSTDCADNTTGRRYGAAFIGSLAPPPVLCRELCKGVGLVAAADSGLVTAENAGVGRDERDIQDNRVSFIG
jgi:hypothetical protein